MEKDEQQYYLTKMYPDVVYPINFSKYNLLDPHFDLEHCFNYIIDRQDYQYLSNSLKHVIGIPGIRKTYLQYIKIRN